MDFPEVTIIFVKLTLLLCLVETLSKTLIYLMFATGDIKRYQMILGSLTLLTVPLAVLVLWLGFPPQSTLYVTIIVSASALFLRLILLNQMIHFPVKIYLIEVVLRVTIVFAVVFLLTNLTTHVLPLGWVRFLLSFMVSFVSILFCVLLFGLGSEEKNIGKQYLLSFITRWRRK